MMHDEAINVDGFFRVILRYLLGLIDMNIVRLVSNFMNSHDHYLESPDRAARTSLSIDMASSE